MALVLREHGIPTRLVTGFAGGERGPSAPYYLVRGREAHAWLGAWCGPERGLGLLRLDAGLRAAAGDAPRRRPERAKFFGNLEFLYGRWILGFAQADQASIATAVRDAVAAVEEKAKAVARAVSSIAKMEGRLASSWASSYPARRSPRSSSSSSGSRGAPGASARGGLPACLRVLQAAPAAPPAAGRRPDARLRAGGDALHGGPPRRGRSSPPDRPRLRRRVVRRAADLPGRGGNAHRPF